MALHFYEAETNNVRLPVGWFLIHGAVTQRWVHNSAQPLTLNLSVTTTEARCLIESVVANNPSAEVVVCYREDRDILRMLIFKGTAEAFEGYEWNPTPAWYFPTSQVKSRYDRLGEDDGVE